MSKKIIAVIVALFVLVVWEFFNDYSWILFNLYVWPLYLSSLAGILIYRERKNEFCTEDIKMGLAINFIIFFLLPIPFCLGNLMGERSELLILLAYLVILCLFIVGVGYIIKGIFLSNKRKETVESLQENKTVESLQENKTEERSKITVKMPFAWFGLLFGSCVFIALAFLIVGSYFEVRKDESGVSGIGFLLLFFITVPFLILGLAVALIGFFAIVKANKKQ